MFEVFHGAGLKIKTHFYDVIMRSQNLGEKLHTFAFNLLHYNFGVDFTSMHIFVDIGLNSVSRLTLHFIVGRKCFSINGKKNVSSKNNRQQNTFIIQNSRHTKMNDIRVSFTKN